MLDESAIDMEQLKSCSPLSSSNYQANVGLKLRGRVWKERGEDDDDHIEFSDAKHVKSAFISEEEAETKIFKQ